MRVYRRKDFLGLPSGTLYCKGKPWFFEDLHVKGDTWVNDFTCLGLQWVSAADSGDAASKLDEMLENGASYPMEDSYGRDGCFDDEDLFLVYEASDLIDLREIINKALVIATLPTK